MQEIIDYVNVTCEIFTTLYGIVLFLIILALYAFYLCVIEDERLTVATIIKLIVYPFMFTYGVIMMAVSKLLEKTAVQRIGSFIMLLPIIITFLVFTIKSIKNSRNTQ